MKSVTVKKSKRLIENRFYKDENLTSENIIKAFNLAGWQETRDWLGRDDDLTFIKSSSRISFDIVPKSGYNFIYYRDFEPKEYAADYIIYSGRNLKELEMDIEDFNNLEAKDFLKYKAPEFPWIKTTQETEMLENKELKERVLDYDTYDEFYKKGCEAYFEGKSLDEVPVTGNAWFREAWQEGWKDSKAADDEDVRRAEAEYEEELDWEDYYSSLSESESKLTESRVKLTKNHDNIVEALRAAIASFQSIGVQVQLIDEMFGQKTLDVSYGPYHVFFDTLDDEDGLYDGYGKYLLTLPLANESDVQWIGGNENELFADLKDVFNVLDKIMAEPNKNDRNFAD